MTNSYFLQQRELSKLKSSLPSSIIPTINNLTNGVYRIMNSYEGSGGMNLAILHQERVTSIDPIKRVFTTTPITPHPIIVLLDSSLTSKNNTNKFYTGFVEVCTDLNGKKEIGTYFPF